MPKATKSPAPPNRGAALHRVMALAGAGKRDAALRLAEDALRQWPDHADALIVAGMVRLQCGRVADASTALRRATELRPDRADGWMQRGLAERAAGDGEACVDSFERALAAGFDRAVALNHLGDGLLYLGRADEALGRFDEAMEIRPEVRTLSNRARVLTELGRYEDAVSACEKALAQDPKLVDARLNLAEAFARSEAFQDAAQAYEAVLAVQPRDARALRGRALALGAIGDGPQALEAAEAVLAQNFGDRIGLALKAAALVEAGRPTEAEALQGFDRFVEVLAPPPPQGYETMAAFTADLAAHALNHPTLKSDPKHNATQNGEHSGDLTRHDETGVMTAFTAMLDGIIRAKIAGFDAGDDHPFARSAPRRWKYDIWCVVMRDGGHQKPHIHPTGWLSGAFYAQTPPAIPTDAAGEAEPPGWIEVGRPGPRVRTRAAHPTRIFRPEAGRLVVFPSYVHHRTIPLSGDTPRISVAFDVVPLA